MKYYIQTNINYNTSHVMKNTILFLNNSLFMNLVQNFQNEFFKFIREIASAPS